MHSLLLVDDEALVRLGVKRCVDWRGLGVDPIYEAANGREALEVLRAHKVDVMITDIKMAVMDGLMLLREIEGLPHRPEVLVMSCYNDYDNMREAMQRGVRDFLFKPRMVPEDIAESVRRVLEGIAPGAEEAAASSNSENMPATIANALSYIGQNLADPDLSLDRVAGEVGLSSAYFSRLFKSVLGQNYSEYITVKRIELADELCRTTTLKVREIARRTGYINIRYFSKIYKRLTGSSISARRQ